MKEILKPTGRWWFAGLLLLCLLSFVHTVKGQESIGVNEMVGGEFLPDYLRQAATNNPDIHSKYNRYLSALERVPQVSVLPDPVFSFGYYIQPVQTRNGSIDYIFELNQAIPFFGVLGSQETVESHLANVEYYIYSNTQTQLFYEIKESWYKLYELQKEIEITQKNLDLLNYLEKLALKKYETGQGSLVDVLRVQLDIRELENDLQTLELDKAPLEVTFNTKLHRDVKSKVRFPEFMRLTSIDTTHLLDSIYANNSTMKKIMAQQGAARENKRLAKLQGFPNFNFGIFYAKVSPIAFLPAVESGEDIILPTVGLSLPIYRKKYKALKQEARHYLTETTEARNEWRNELTRAYTKAMRNRKDALLKIELYKLQIREGEHALNLLIREFSTAGEDFEEVLRMQRQILGYELALVRAQVQHNIAVAELDRLRSKKE